LLLLLLLLIVATIARRRSSNSLFYWLLEPSLSQSSWRSRHPMHPHPFWDCGVAIGSNLEMSCEVDAQSGPLSIKEGCRSIPGYQILQGSPLRLLHHQEPLVEAGLGAGGPPMLRLFAEVRQPQRSPLGEASDPAGWAG
jgi:hypothetical protein